MRAAGYPDADIEAAWARVQREAPDRTRLFACTLFGSVLVQLAVPLVTALINRMAWPPRAFTVTHPLFGGPLLIGAVMGSLVFMRNPADRHLAWGSLASVPLAAAIATFCVLHKLTDGLGSLT